MIENKRTHRRFDLPLIVKFRPVAGAASYSLGLTKNLCCEGISLEARNFNFDLQENLELELKLPQNAGSVSLLGDVVWKRQNGKSSYAGIAFKVQDQKTHNNAMEKITSYTKIPLLSAFYGKKSEKEIEEEFEEKPFLKPADAESVSGYDIGTASNMSFNKSRVLGLTKQYVNNEKECKITFLLPQEAAQGAITITVVGDFNNWNIDATPMIRDNNGDFHITLTLSAGREYRFRYLLDGSRWENDWLADKYVPNAFGSDDSVVIV